MKTNPSYKEILEELTVLQQRMVALQKFVTQKVEEEQLNKYKKK